MNTPNHPFLFQYSGNQQERDESDAHTATVRGRYPDMAREKESEIQARSRKTSVYGHDKEEEVPQLPQQRRRVAGRIATSSEEGGSGGHCEINRGSVLRRWLLGCPYLGECVLSASHLRLLELVS